MASNQFRLLVRSLSTSVARNQMVKPPVQVFGVEGRYATAVYSAASKSKHLEAVEKELSGFQTALKKDPRLGDYLLNPSLTRTAKVDAMKQVAAKLQLTASTGNLLALLAENNRLKYLNGIINQFKIIMAAHRGDLPCQVTTAKPLDDAMKAELMAALKAFTKKGENILLDVKVDPNIIGGMIISIGDKYVDMSIATKVKKYTDIIQAAA